MAKKDGAEIQQRSLDIPVTEQRDDKAASEGCRENGNVRGD